jgi:3-methyl-2-oxobutanoate hydroxymethyltransferase
MSHHTAESNRLSVLDFQARKASKEKISMVTCYDYTSAQVLNQTRIDTLLVGDSLAMVMHGFDSTVHATVEMMALHVAAVARGAPNKFIVGDMPFLAARKGMKEAMEAVGQLMQAGAHSVKIEGEKGQAELMAHIVDSGVPVMGHLGLTPQSVHGLGGHKVQGKAAEDARALVESAKRLADSGCFALVLECVPTALAAEITRSIPIPTIGIGAGSQTDGQVLVLQDMLGMNPGFKPKFLKHYACAHAMMTDAVNRFDAEIRHGCFPTAKESYR